MLAEYIRQEVRIAHTRLRCPAHAKRPKFVRAIVDSCEYAREELTESFLTRRPIVRTRTL